jgi:hypothetical protein
VFKTFFLKRNNKSWSFNAEAGIMYQGKEKIKVSATGYAAQQQSTIDDLNRDANAALKRVKKYLKFFFANMYSFIGLI